MNSNAALNQQGETGREDFLLEATLDYLRSLAPELADAFFRGAILRWFTPEALTALAGVGTISGFEAPPPGCGMDVGEIYERLRELPFAEQFPSRGFSFHDLTRELVLGYLWREELDFYRLVSDKAAAFFAARLNAQAEQSSQGEIDDSQVDWDLGIEYAYHSVIADEQAAADGVERFLGFLLEQRRLGTYHAVLQALSEHAAAGRLSTELLATMKVWQLQELSATYNLAALEKLTSEIRLAPDDVAPPWLKAEATYLLAFGFRLAARYDEAEALLKENLEQHKGLEDGAGALRAVIELGRLEQYREDNDKALEYFADALAYHVQELRVQASEDSEYKEEVPLLIFTPDAWHRREMYLVKEEEAAEDAATPSANGDNGTAPDSSLHPTAHAMDEAEVTTPEAGNGNGASEEEAPERVILYCIEFDAEAMGLDAREVREDESGRYEWPVDFDGMLAGLWLDIAYLCRTTDQYDTAAACARLAGQMYDDLGDLAGAQSAASFLETLGASRIDREYVETMQALQSRIMDEAMARKDQRAVLQGLISRAGAAGSSEKDADAKRLYDQARELAQSLQLKNEEATCTNGLAKLMWNAKDYDGAIGLLQRAIELYDEVQNREGCASSLLDLGDLYVDQRLLPEAEQCYQAALATYEGLRVFSGRFSALLGLSGVRTTAGDYEGSFSYLSEALALSRSKKDTRLTSEAVALSQMAALALSLGDTEQSQALFDEAIAITEKITNKQLAGSMLAGRASTMSEMAEYELAIKLYDQAAECDPTGTRTHSGKGWALLALGKDRAAEARATLEKEIELRPDHLWSYKELGNALRMMGETQAATAKYQWVIDQTEGAEVRPADLPTKAWCYYQLGRFADAEAVLRRVIAADPDPISDWYDLGLVILCSGRPAEALSAYQEGAARMECTLPPLLRLGWIHIALSDLEDAVERHPEVPAEAVWRIKSLLADERELARAGLPRKPLSN